MSRFLRILALVVVAAVAAAVALPFLIPVQTYKGQIERLASDGLGRAVTIGGDIGFTLWPAVGLKVADVTVANAPGAKDPAMAQIGELTVGVTLLPLLSGELQVERLVLQDATVNLETDRAGKGNWALGPGGAAAPGGSGVTLDQIGLGDVRLANGRIVFRDGKTGATTTLENIDAAVRLPSLDAPLAVDGSLVYRGETLDLDVTAAKPRALLAGGATPVTLALDSAIADATLDGAFNAGTGAVTGALDLSAPSLRKFAAWNGTTLPENGGFGAFAAEGRLTAQGAKIALADLTLALDALRATGALSLDASGKTPALRGTLAVDTLDVNPYLGGAGPGGAQAASGVSAASGWSEAPLDLSGLKAFDATLALTAQTLKLQRMTFTDSAVDLTVKGGVLTAALKGMSLYGGKGQGTLVLDGSGRTPTIKNALTVNDVQGLPFLSDAIGMTSLEGIGALQVELAGSGGSQAAIMRSLSGRGSLTFRDGAIIGVNLAQVARTIQSALSGQAVAADAKTDFAELGGTFTIAKGVLANDDLRLLNPFVRLSGKGVADLGAQTLNYRIEPRAVADMQGQGGQAGAGGLGIPFRIEGPWNNLSYRPDLNPADIVNLLSGQGMPQGLEGLGGLLGQPPAQPGQEPRQPGLQDLLPGLLGQPQQPPAEQAPAEEQGQEPPAEQPDEQPQQAPAPAPNPVEQLLRGLQRPEGGG